MLNPVLAMAIGIVVMMVLIIFTKMHAFPSLIISAILIAVLAMPFVPGGSHSCDPDRMCKHRYQGLWKHYGKYRRCNRLWLYHGNFP